MTVSFAELIKEYMTHTPPRVGYWRIYKERLWRLCGSKAYKGNRDAILARYKKQRNRWGKKILTGMITKDFILHKVLGEKDFAPSVFRMKS